jgi:transposase
VAGRVPDGRRSGAGISPGDGEELESERLKARLGQVLTERDLLAEMVTVLEAGGPI